MRFRPGVFSRFTLAALVLSIPVLVNAAEQKKDCFGFDGVYDDPLAANLYEVQPGDKVEFQCPERSLLCKKGAFLLPGDQVVVSRVDGDKACAEYLSPAKSSDYETAGWLPMDRLASKTPVPDWAGRWGDSETVIMAKPVKDRVRIDAKADLQFGNGDQGGQFAALISGAESKVQFGYTPGYDGKSEKLLPYQDTSDPGVCQVKMNQLGRYLVVGDNHMCGGINVSFSRVYRRFDEKAPAHQDQATAARPSEGGKPDGSGIRPSYKACLDKSGGVTVAMRNCADAEYKYQDDRLNRVYRTLHANLNKAAAVQLRNEQRLWIGQRDGECKVDQNGGTAELIVSDDCAVQAAAKRAMELESRLSR